MILWDLLRRSRRSKNGESRKWAARFGKLCLWVTFTIGRYYPHGCWCDHRIKTFFHNFHHCTRWKIDVYKDFLHQGTFIWKAATIDRSSARKLRVIKRKSPTHHILLFQEDKGPHHEKQPYPETEGSRQDKSDLPIPLYHWWVCPPKPIRSVIHWLDNLHVIKKVVWSPSRCVQW